LGPLAHHPVRLAQFNEPIALDRRLTPEDFPAIEAALVEYCQEVGEQTGTLIHALRLSTTGQAVGPGVYDCLAILGKDKSLARIDSALAR
jgi:glutamyl-tRNA synthetase